MVSMLREFRAARVARLVELLREHHLDEGALQDGRVFQDGIRMRDGESLIACGRTIRVYPSQFVESSFDVLHCDEHMLVAHKPAGLSTIPDQRGDSASLLGLVAAKLGMSLESVHATSRLDRDVSGVVIFALTPEMRTRLKTARDLGTYERRYVAVASTPIAVKSRSRGAQRRARARTTQSVPALLVTGAAKRPGPLGYPELMQWDMPIGASADGRAQAVNGKDAVMASTRARIAAWTFEPEQDAQPNYALLAVQPRTGRTHQIRVHAAFAGLPLLGDDAYGGTRRLTLANGSVRAIERIALHALAVRVPGYPVFVAELPPFMRSLWSLLGGIEQAWDTAAQCAFE